MISYLKGAIIAKTESSVIVDVADLGFEVFLPLPLLRELREGDAVTLWTHEYLREDARDLYGFKSAEELRFFRRLITISGVGPRTALHILSTGSLAKVRKAIAEGDIGFLTSVPGVGKKTAQKVILEMRGALGEEHGSEMLVDALIGLGYSRSEAREAAKQVPEGEPEAQIRAALKILGKK
ncbi:MAG: Holliday junction branch migration protein RuvA [Patescibacteria group bacterium]